MKTTNVIIRCSEEEKTLLSMRAKAAGLTIAAFVRATCIYPDQESVLAKAENQPIVNTTRPQQPSITEAPCLDRCIRLGLRECEVCPRNQRLL